MTDSLEDKAFQRAVAIEIDRAAIDLRDSIANQMWGGEWRSYTWIRYRPVLFPRIARLEERWQRVTTMYVGVHLPHLRRLVLRARYGNRRRRV